MRYFVRTSLLAILALGRAACSVVPLPSISAVESDTVVSSDIATARSGQPTTLTIRGSDVGDPRGLNRLFYGGIEVSDAVIASWGDDAIELEFFDPTEIVEADFLRAGDMRLAVAGRRGTYVAPDDQRFEVCTLGGAAESSVVRLVSPRLSVGYSSAPGASVTVSFEARDVFGHPWPDLDVTLETNRGTLGATALVTNVSGFADTTLTTVDSLPHAVRAMHAGRSVAQDVAGGLHDQSTPNPLYVTPDVEAMTEVTLTDAAATPAADTSLEWLLVSEMGPRYGLYDLGTRATDASGTVELPIPGLPIGLWHEVFMIEEGYVVGSVGVLATTETSSGPF